MFSEQSARSAQPGIQKTEYPAYNDSSKPHSFAVVMAGIKRQCAGAGIIDKRINQYVPKYSDRIILIMFRARV